MLWAIPNTVFSYRPTPDHYILLYPTEIRPRIYSYKNSNSKLHVDGVWDSDL